MKNITKIIFFFTVSLALILGIEYFIPELDLLLRRPDLLKGIYGDNSTKEVEFEVRVLEAFSKKIKHEVIKEKLSRQGFLINESRDLKVAYYVEKNIACRISWLIKWEIDKQGYIYNLKTDRGSVCL